MGSLIKYGSYSKEAAQEEKEILDQSGSSFMKLVVGRNTVRFLPPKIGRTSPFAVVYEHYVQTDGMSAQARFVCPRMMAKQPCPACQHVDKLRATGNAADYDKAGDFLPKLRIYACVIDRSHQEMGPRVLAFGKSVHKALTDIRDDDVSGGDFCNPEEGFDIVIAREGTGKMDTEYKVRTARETSPLAETVEQMNDWIESQLDVEQYARVPPPEELRRILNMAPTEAPSTGLGRPVGAGGVVRRARTAQDDLEGGEK